MVAARNRPSGPGARIFYPRDAAVAHHCRARASTGLLEPSAKALIPYVDIEAFRCLAAQTETVPSWPQEVALMRKPNFSGPTSYRKRVRLISGGVAALARRSP